MVEQACTLVGVATGSPDGGVAIVRLSGPRAFAIGESLCGVLPGPRRLVRRTIALAEAVEDGLVVAMPGPGSFTGEDVLELHVHGGALNVRAVIEACLGAGAVAAGPGDFSRRAFELGRLGLDEAEGIAAVVGAQTEEALAQARRLASGEVGREVEAEIEALADLRAEIEANLDFPDDVAGADVQRWRSEVQARRSILQGWLSRFEAGRRAREQARVVLAGPVNAGKSSLFNALLGRARAIVAAEPGTTRDYVESAWKVGRFEAVLVDTAGLREGTGAVEVAGIELGRAQVQSADVVVWVEAAHVAAALEPEWPPGCEVVRVESKRDLGNTRDAWLGASVRDERSVEGLRSRIEAWFLAGQGGVWIGLARHRDGAQAAVEALDEAARELARDDALELVAFSLGVAVARLGEITGRNPLGPVGADVLDRVFARFCIGK